MKKTPPCGFVPPKQTFNKTTPGNKIHSFIHSLLPPCLYSSYPRSPVSFLIGGNCLTSEFCHISNIDTCARAYEELGLSGDSDGRATQISNIQGPAFCFFSSDTGLRFNVGPKGGQQYNVGSSEVINLCISCPEEPGAPCSTTTGASGDNDDEKSMFMCACMYVSACEYVCLCMHACMCLCILILF